MRIQILSSICLLTLNLNSFSQALFHANFEEHPVTSALYYDSDEAFFIDNIKFEGQLGLTGPNHSNSRVVPNPVTTNFSISSRPFDLRAIYIKNIFGRTVWRGSSEHSAWEISHLNSGLYFLNIERDNSTWTQKIIKN